MRLQTKIGTNLKVTPRLGRQSFASTLQTKVFMEISSPRTPASALSWDWSQSPPYFPREYGGACRFMGKLPSLPHQRRLRDRSFLKRSHKKLPPTSSPRPCPQHPLRPRAAHPTLRQSDGSREAAPMACSRRRQANWRRFRKLRACVTGRQPWAAPSSSTWRIRFPTKCIA